MADTAPNCLGAGASVRMPLGRAPGWRGDEVQNTFGVQVRHDDISNVWAYHTEARVRRETQSQASVLESTGGVHAKNEIAWTPRSRFAALAINSGTVSAGLVHFDAWNDRRPASAETRTRDSLLCKRLARS